MIEGRYSSITLDLGGRRREAVKFTNRPLHLQGKNPFAPIG
jgi:hypothetical protein